MEQPLPSYCMLKPQSSDYMAWLREALLAEQRDMDDRLKLAVLAKNTKTAVDLIRRGANTSFLVDGRPHLHHLVMKKMDAILRCCIEHGAELKAVDRKLTPLLHFAVDSSSIQVIEILLDSMDVNMSDFQGDTPLFCAMYTKNFVVINLLLQKGAGVNVQNSYGDTPLHLAVHESCHWLVKELLQHGANVQVRNKDGDTALDDALNFSKGKFDSSIIPIIKELLAWGAVVDERTAEAVTVLVYDRNCELATLKRVVEKTEYVNGLGLGNKRTPLHYAVQNNRLDLARVLLENGAKIDALDSDGFAPLHYGFEDCSSRMVMFMIDMGASLSSRC